MSQTDHADFGEVRGEVVDKKKANLTFLNVSTALKERQHAISF